MINKIEKITINLINDNYCPIKVKYNDHESIEGGGNIYEAIVGILGIVLDDKTVKNKWDRLQIKDRVQISKKIKSAFILCSDDIEYYIKNNYKK